MSTNDTRVVQLAEHQRKSRERLIEQLFADHREAVRCFLRMRLLSDHDQEDVLQDMFLRLSAMPDLQQRLTGGSDRIRNYLFTMAANLANDRIRRAQVRRKAQHEVAFGQKNRGDYGSPEDQVAASQHLAAMRKVLMTLKVKQRNAFVLSRFKSLSYPEIARQMGISVSAVEKYISNTLYLLDREISGKH